MVSGVTKMPAQWFPFKERYYATSFGVLAGMVGYGLGDSTENIFGRDHPVGFAISLTVIGGIALALLVVFY